MWWLRNRPTTGAIGAAGFFGDDQPKLTEARDIRAAKPSKALMPRRGLASNAASAQADTGATAVFCYEHDACFFEGRYELLGGLSSATNLAIFRFPAAQLLARTLPTPQSHR